VVRCALVLAVLCSLAGRASAGLVTFDFAVSAGGAGVAHGARLEALGLTRGLAMRGAISYDPAAPGASVPDPIFGGDMLAFSSPGAMALEVGGHTFASAAGAAVQIEWHPGTVSSSPGLSYPALLTFRVALGPGSYGDPREGSYLRLDVYPVGPQSWAGRPPNDLGAFGGGSGLVSVRLAGADPSSPELYLDGVVTSVTPRSAPEPGALALAAVGGGLALLGRRAARRRGKIKGAELGQGGTERWAKRRAASRGPAGARW
jgi:hypothetical protein